MSAESYCFPLLRASVHMFDLTISLNPECDYNIIIFGKKWLDISRSPPRSREVLSSRSGTLCICAVCRYTIDVLADGGDSGVGGGRWQSVCVCVTACMCVRADASVFMAITPERGRDNDPRYTVNVASIRRFCVS